MGLPLIMLIWVAITAWVVRYNSKTELADDGTISYKTSWTMALLILSLPIVLCATRVRFVDTTSYIQGFQAVPNDMSQFSSYVTSFDDGNLYYGLQMLFHNYISSDVQVWLSFISIIEMVLVSRTVRKYSVDYAMSIFLFFATGMVLSWICNGFRQFLVVTILFSMTKYVLENKWIRVLVVAVFLMGVSPIYNFFGINRIPFLLFGGVHQSVLVYIIVLFFVRGDLFNKRLLIAVGVLFLIIAFGGLNSLVETSASGTTYANNLEEKELTSTGTNMIRIVVSWIPIVLVLLKRKIIFEDTDTIPNVIKLSINMSLVSAVIYFASGLTSGIYVGRLPIYFEIYNLLLLPWIINYLYKDNRKSLSIITYVFYIAFYLYQIFIAWGDCEYLIKIFGIWYQL